MKLYSVQDGGDTIYFATKTEARNFIEDERGGKGKIESVTAQKMSAKELALSILNGTGWVDKYEEVETRS